MLLWHNWTTEYVVKMSYDTKIFTSHLRLEQRRSLRTTPLLEFSISCLSFDQNARRFIGMKKENLYVPFEPECFTGTRGLVGTKTVTITSDISDFFFLKNIALYLCDSNGNIGEISSVVGSVITLTADLAGTANIFYPCFKCFCKDVTVAYPTPATTEANLTLEQIKE